jgi:hypothetical protein
MFFKFNSGKSEVIGAVGHRIWGAACPKPQHRQMQEYLEKFL